MVNWHRFTPNDFEYDFERDELATHNVTFEEAIECFFSDFEVRRKKTQDYLSTQTKECCSHYYGVVSMSTRGKTRKNLSEKDIDQMVVAQANDESAWEKPIRVGRTKGASLSIPADLAVRAAFLARLHRKTNVEEWLTHIIKERVELEEAAFVGAKHELAAKTG